MEVLDLRTSDISLEQLATYLSGFETENQYSYSQWLKRLRFYWDLNPHFSPEAPRGWALVKDAKIRGFIGAINGEFQATVGGLRKFIPVLSATTWRVDSECRGESMHLFMRYMQGKKDHLLVDTTPTPSVEKILNTFKFEGPFLSHNYLIPLIGPGPLTRVLNPSLWKASGGEKISQAQLANLTVNFDSPEGYAQRHITRALLDWYCFKSIHEKHLYGVIENNDLKAYVIFLKEIFRGQPILRVVDFQAQAGHFNSLYKLVARVAAGAGNEYNARLLVFTAIPANPTQAEFRLPAPNKKKLDQHHYLFGTPTVRNGLKWAPKLFDGDYGC